MRHFMSLLVLIGAASSIGCMGLYVEGQATMYPSLKYTEETAPKPGEQVSGEGGSGFGFGVNVGVAFEGKRSSRFGMGYVARSTSLPGGSTSGGIADFRYDGKIARLGSGKLLRLGFGSALGTASNTKLDTVTGGTVEDKGLMLEAYGGLTYAQYFGKRHELSAMGSASWATIGAPNGMFRGAGLGLKLTYTFMFGDTRPDTTFIVPLDTSRNLMPGIESAAKKAGCSAEYGEKRAETEGGGYGLVGAYVDAKCDGEEIFFLQNKRGMGILCSKMEEDDCQGLAMKIIDAAKSTPAKTESAAPPPPAPTPPKAEPPKTEPPKTEPPKDDATKPGEPKPGDPAPSSPAAPLPQ